VLLGWVGVRGFLAREHLLKARSEVTQLQAAITAGEVDDLSVRLASIRHEARAARGLTSDFVWSGLSAMPWLGASLHSANQVAQSVDQVANEVLPPLVEATDTIQPRTLRQQNGTLQLARLPAALPDLLVSGRALSSARDRLESTSTSGVAAPIADAQQTLADSLTGLARSLDTASRAAEIAPAMAGADGVRRYLVVFQTPAEARGTGGIAGSYAVVRFDDGKMTTERTGSDADFKGATSPVVDLGGDFNSRYAQIDSAEDWGNANFTPNFPWAAQIWAKLWERQSGERMDGVIAVDPIALGYLLAVTGPVTLSNGQVISSENAARWTMSDSYRIEDVALRKNLNVELSQLTLDHLSAAGISLTELLKVAGRAAGERHLQLWSARRAEETIIADTPVGGELSDAPGPFAELVLLNGRGDKLDYYLQRSLQYRVVSCATKARSVQVSFTLTNTAPKSGLPSYVTSNNDHRVVPVGQSRVFAELYMAQGAIFKSWKLDGKTVIARLAQERGHSVVEFDIELPPGQSRTVTADVTEPPSKAKVTIPVQPLANPLTVTTSGSC
jgi:Protein of unknown function (DUF4012)